MNPDQKFFEYIGEWARSQKCTFIEQGCDGRESYKLIDGMAADDVWGWLLPEGVKTPEDKYFGCIIWEEIEGRLHLKWDPS